MNTAAVQSADVVRFIEVQPYRELPPVRLLTVVSALFGWGLFIWTVVLGRPLGHLEVPLWLGVLLGFGFGVVLPALFLWARMTTRVYADRICINTGLAGSLTFAYRDIAAVEMRTQDLRADYSNRNVGTKDNTRTAYAVHSLQGTQLTLEDGRFILIGSKNPEELSSAIDSAWQAAKISL